MQTLTHPKGDIPADKTFDLELTCWQAHPGVCMAEAARHWHAIEAAGKSLLRAGMAKTFIEGSFIRLKVVAGVFVEYAYLCCAYIRGGGPRLVVFAECDCVGGPDGQSQLRFIIDDDGCVLAGHLAAVWRALKKRGVEADSVS